VTLGYNRVQLQFLLCASASLREMVLVAAAGRAGLFVSFVVEKCVVAEFFFAWFAYFAVDKQFPVARWKPLRAAGSVGIDHPQIQKGKSARIGVICGG